MTKKLCLEHGYTSLIQWGEELCGDKVEYAVNGDYTTVVLADGLGHGVKANILATLTSKILCTMFSAGRSVEECVDTIIQSLPVCKERGVAYSTFSVIHVNNNGEGYLLEFDNPKAIYWHEGRCVELPCSKLTVHGKTVYQSELSLSEDDIIFVMSDGTVHAGIGGMFDFGWKRSGIIAYLNREIKPGLSARASCCILASACNLFYKGKPGDDTTVAAIKMRKQVWANLMIGPPVDREQDYAVVANFMEGDTLKIVCGGTSSNVVSRCIGSELEPVLDFPDRDIPPIAHMEGIDLVTEGVITFRRLLELSDKYISVTDLSPKTYTARDGASLLAQMLFEEATDIKFFVGQAVNKAHSDLPIDITMKLRLVDRLAENLRRMGKRVVLTYD